MSYRWQKNPLYSYQESLEMIEAVDDYDSALTARKTILADKDNYTGREYMSLHDKVNRKLAEIMLRKGKKDDK